MFTETAASAASRGRSRSASVAVGNVPDGAVLDRTLLMTGALLPLLGGGNVLFVVEPQDAMRYLGLAAVGVWWLLARGVKRVEPKGVAPTVAVGCLLLLAAWWLAMLVLRASGPRAFLEAQGLFAGILLFAGLSCRSLQRTDVVALIHGLLIGTSVTAAYGQYQYWIVFPRLMPILAAAHAPAIDLVNANFYNANCYAAFLSAVILLGIGSLGEHVRGVTRGVTLVAVVALAVTLLLSESRSTMGMLLFASATLLAIGSRRVGPARRTLRHPLLWVVAAAIVGFSAAFAMVNLEELWHVGLLGRLAVWQGSLAMIRAHWLTGVGIGRFWDYFPSYRVTSYYTRYPHNFLLEIFAELGIVGFTAMMGFVVSAFTRPLRLLASLIRHDGRGPSLPASLILASLLLFAHALVDIDWHAPANPILLLVLLGASQRLQATSETGT